MQCTFKVAKRDTDQSNGACGTGQDWSISQDHRLLHLIGYNVTRGLFMNLSILDVVWIYFPQSFSSCGPAPVFPTAPDPEAMWDETMRSMLNLPRGLAPTTKQLEMAHPRWIDLVPCAQLRNNLIDIYTLGTVDMDELAEDLVGSVFDEQTCDAAINVTIEADGSLSQCDYAETRGEFKECGIVAWSDPWEISGWEFQGKVIEKWAFVFQGCYELLASTNRWRIARGEDALDHGVI